MKSVLRALPCFAPAALIGLLLIGCGDAENSGDSTRGTTRPSPVSVAQVCFEPAALQVNGGKLLHAMNVKEEGGTTGTRITSTRLNAVAHGAFAPSLRASLPSMKKAGSRAKELIAAANAGLAATRRDPSILLDERRLAETFAEAQRLAERDGFATPGCDG